MALPFLPDETDEERRFCKEVVRAQLRDFEETQQKIKVTRDSWCLQATQMGDPMIAFFESDDALQ
jgi:hypothetical protein